MNTPTDAVNPETVVPPVETPVAPVEPVKETKEPTMEEIHESVPEVKETVGLDKFLELKKENKEFKKSIKDLEARISEGASRTEVSADIKALSEEYPDVDKNFLNKLAFTIKAQVEEGAKAQIAERLKPLEDKEKSAKIDAAFNTHFNLALDQMPEFKDIVNPEVIKTLSLNPKNANKNFRQIIEETYGNALAGKRTIDSTVPAGGKEPAPLDFKRASSDISYFNEVMSNPKLKAEYNDKMLRSGF